MRQETSDCICLSRGHPAWDLLPWHWGSMCTVLRCCYAETFTSLSSLPAIIHRMTVASGTFGLCVFSLSSAPWSRPTSPQDPLLTTALDGRHQRATLTCQRPLLHTVLSIVAFS